MLGIKIKLLTSFHPQTDRQTECMNQELKQYLQIFVDYKQKNWLEWLTLTEFIVNNKIYLVANMFLFIVNYGRKLKIGANIRKKEKVEKITKFAERIKKVQIKTKVALSKAQKKMKR